MCINASFTSTHYVTGDESILSPMTAILHDTSSNAELNSKMHQGNPGADGPGNVQIETTPLRILARSDSVPLHLCTMSELLSKHDGQPFLQFNTRALHHL